MKSSKFIFIVILFCSCSFASQQKRVEDGIKDADSTLHADYYQKRNNLEDCYHKALRFNHAISINNKLRNYHDALNNSLTYIDSLKTVVSKIDSTDVNNYLVVKKLFIQDGAGDKLFAKLKLSYDLTENITLNQDRKEAVIKSKNELFKNPEVHKTEEVLFGLNSPKGVSWLLYGVEQELLDIGTNSLKDYYSN